MSAVVRLATEDGRWVGSEEGLSVPEIEITTNVNLPDGESRKSPFPDRSGYLAAESDLESPLTSNFEIPAFLRRATPAKVWTSGNARYFPVLGSLSEFLRDSKDELLKSAGLAQETPADDRSRAAAPSLRPDATSKENLDDAQTGPKSPIMTDPISRQEVDAKLQAGHAEMRADAAELRADFEVLRGELNTASAKLLGEVNTGFQSIRTEIHAAQNTQIRWVVGTALAFAAITVTVLTFVMNNASPKAAASVAAPTATPTFIYVPMPAPAASTSPVPAATPK